MWRTVLFLFLLSGFPALRLISQNPGGNAQPDFPLRIEVPVRTANETYRIIPAGASGLIMFYRSMEAEDDQRTRWYFTCYDTNLQQRWVKSVPLYNDQEFRIQQEGHDTLALLFCTGEKSKSPDRFYQILRIVPKSGILILNAGKIDDGSTADVFTIAKGRAWLGLSTRGKISKVLNTRLKDGISQIFTPGIGSQLNILRMQADTATGLLSAVVSRQISKKDVEYYLVRYDTNGVIKREVMLGTQTDEHTLNNLDFVSLPLGGDLLLGSYRLGPLRAAPKNNIPEESTGLFASAVRGGTQKSANFYNFLELQNASTIVGASDIAELQKKALKKQKKLTDYSLDYSVLMHEIIPVNDQYILSAELFSPQYHTENFTDFDFYGRPYTNSYSVFDGYRFFHAIVAAFDTEGKLLWDNNIEIRNLVSPELTPKVSVYQNAGGMVLCYISDGKIGSKIIRENQVVEKLDFTSIDLLYPEDKLISETRGVMVHWYKNYFLSYGYQEIKNIALESNNRRMVFQFTKIRFD